MGYNWNWQIIWQYRTALSEALGLSLMLAAASIAIGLAFGLCLAYLSVAQSPCIRLLASTMGRIIRSTPLLLLVFTLYLVLPQWGIRLFSPNSAFVAALSITAGGYLAENIRAGLESLPRHHMDAAKSIGLTGLQRQLHVVLPLVMRHAFPALTNSIVATFKDTSIASVIAVAELTYVAKEISTNYFRVFEAWSAVSLIYLAVSAVIALMLQIIERRLPGRSA